MKIKLLLILLIIPLLLITACSDDKEEPIDPDLPPEPQDGWTFYTTRNSPLPEWTVKAIAIDAVGNKWLGTGGGGVVYFDDKNYQWTTYTNMGGFINKIHIDADGIVWVGTLSAGLWKYDGTDWTWIGAIPDGDIYALTTDMAGNLWVGTHRAGLMKFDGQTWTQYNTDNSDIPSNWVFSIAADLDSILWLGTAYRGLTRFDGASWEIYDHQNSPIREGQYTYSTTVDGNDRKFIGTGPWSDLLIFDNQDWTKYNIHEHSTGPNYLSGEILSIAIDNYENIWIAAHIGGFIKFDGENWTTYNPTRNGGSSHLMECLVYEDETDMVWFGTYGGGLGSYQVNH